MKDKLVKFNHKGSYYLMKKIGVFVLAVLGVSFAIAVPTYIIHNSMNKNTMGLAEENSSEVVEESLEEGNQYESYND